MVLPLLLNSCVTMGLWGSEYRVRPTRDHGLAGWFEPRRGVDWSWWRVGLRIGATPATIAIDIVTLPVQGVFTEQAPGGPDIVEQPGEPGSEAVVVLIALHVLQAATECHYRR